MKNSNYEDKNSKLSEIESVDNKSISLKHFFQKNKHKVEQSRNTTKVFSSYDINPLEEDEKKSEEFAISKKIREIVKDSIDESYKDKISIEKTRLDQLRAKILDSKEKSKSASDITEYNKKSNIYLNYDYKIPGYDDARTTETYKKNQDFTNELHNDFIELAKRNREDPTAEIPSLKNYKELFTIDKGLFNVVEDSFKQSTEEFSFNNDQFSTKEIIIKSINDFQKNDLNFFQLDEKKINNNFSPISNISNFNNNEFNPSQIKNVEKIDWNFNDTFVNEEINYFKDYKYPSSNIFAQKEKDIHVLVSQKKYADEIKVKLLDIFKNQNLGIEILNYDISSRVISFQATLPSGLNINSLIALEENIKIILNVKNIRIQAPIPNKSLIGIEIPYTKANKLSFKEIYNAIDYSFNYKTKDKYKIFLGKDVYNRNLSIDLISYPNVLISGENEIGKQNLLNLFIVSLLMKYNPEELNFVLIDNKGHDLMNYYNLPHLLMPIVNETQKSYNTLNSVIKMIKERYILMMKNKVQNIEKLNEKLKDKAISKVVVIISEFSSLYHLNSPLFSKLISLIKEKGSSTGVYLILATDKPSLENLTIEFLRNIDLRIALPLHNEEISKQLLGKKGTDKLISFDDFLIWRKTETLFRAQAAFISEEEVKNFSKFIENQASPKYQMLVEEKDFDTKYLSENSSLIQAAKIILSRRHNLSVDILKSELNISETTANKTINTLIYIGILKQSNSNSNFFELVKREDIIDDTKNW